MPRRRHLVPPLSVAALALLAAACEAPQSDTSPPPVVEAAAAQRTSASSGTASTSRPGGPTVAGESTPRVQRPTVAVADPAGLTSDEERAIKQAAVESGENMKPIAAPTVVVDVDEDAAAAAVELSPEALPDGAVATLADVPLPVMLPNPERLPGAEPFAELTASRGENWYAIQVPLDGITLALSGSRQAVVHPDLMDKKEAVDDMRIDGRFLLSRTHGIVQVSYLDFGEVAYAIDVECWDHDTDVRCTEDDFILSLARDMQRLGGER